MTFLGFSPFIIISSFLTTLLLDRGVFANGNQQFPTSSPWYPSGPSSASAKPSNEESEALKRVLPLVTFDCRGKTGYFTDSKFNCEVFHYCQPDGARNTFHCPANQLFNQLSMVCEEKTVHNSRLCKEGSINPSKLLPPNKHHNVPNKKGETFTPTPSLNSNTSRASQPKRVMSLEELLSYMNSGHVGKEAEPTFISRFHKAEELLNQSRNSSAIPNTKPESKGEKEVLTTSTTSDVQLSAQGSDQSFSVAKVPSKPGLRSKKKGEDEDISAEYDAIEGRKFRKHKRLGRVIEIQGNQHPKKDDKLSSRSATDLPFLDDATLPPSDDDEARNGSSHSLFATDRTKARDFRKRKRYQGRKRKVLNTGSANDTEAYSTMPITTPGPPATRQDVDALKNNAYRRRKSQRTRTRDDTAKGFQGSSKVEKVEPYTLPPLPTPADDKVELTTMTYKKRDPSKETSRSKNPWHKPTPPPAAEDGNVKFGEKLSDLDQHHYQTDVKAVEGPAPPDYYGMKDISNTSEEEHLEAYSERDPLYTKNSNSGEVRSNQQKNKVKNLEKIPDEDSFKYRLPPEKHQHTIESQNIFPPPRAESREHHSTPPQQMIRESSIEKPKTVHSSSKATTEDPFKVTHPYMGKYQPSVQELKELDEQRWKIESEKAKSNDKKVAVGSTFFFQNGSPETTKKPRLQQQPATTEAPMTIPHKEKDISKHTLAHQHLSKIMNDFFAMSSSNTPGRVHTHLNKEEDFVIPNYRIPEEDIYTSSESIVEDVEEIPPELLEVVDLLTGHVNDNEKSDLKPQASHEVIKISGPITNSQLEKIFLDDKFDEESEHEVSADGSYKKIVVVPQPDDREEDDMKEIAKVAEYTSLKLEPFLKKISGDKSVTVIPLKNEPVLKRQPTVLTAKKIPVRVIYTDELTENVQSKPVATKPNVKLWHSHSPSARLQPIHNGRRAIGRPSTHSFSSHSRPSIVLHPSSLFPPHPPPLPRKQLPFRVGYPFVANSRPLNLNTRQVPRRRKRSIISRLRRQIRQNQNFLPFSSPVFSAFNPKFVPTFSPFKHFFNPISLHASSSHLTPFTFPGFPLAKPSQNRPHIFQPAHPRPPPVRHVTQNGQTVIVEEVPIPIHVEVKSPNQIHPVQNGAHPTKLNQRYPGNQFRTPSPPAIQTPPLLNRPRNRFPSSPTNYQPLGMPSNARPPAMNYPPPVPFPSGLPPSITSDGQLYALGVTNKPLSPPNPHPARPNTNSARNAPRPFNPFEIHPNSYPSFPYFQGAFTTPLTNEPLPGRLMYSGYRPPKSTLGTKPPKPNGRSNKERKTSESKSNRSRSKQTQDYFEAPAKPMRESHVSYTEEVISKGRTRTKPNLNDFSVDHSDFKAPRQSLSKGNSEETVPKKRRPGRRRRPRPQLATTQGTTVLNDISPTPPPPEQIPPPPADYTSKPAHLDVYNSLPGYTEGSKTHETSSHFPPAGYYGKDQLVQFFDSSSKVYKKSNSPKPDNHKELGENTSSAELDESFASISGEDGNQPAFGTRLRSNAGQTKSRHQKSKQPAQSPSQNTEVRTRPIETMNMNQKMKQENENMNQKKREFLQTRPNEGNRMQIRNQNPPPRKRRPPQPRPRNRAPPMTTPHTPLHHFNYNENMGNFYTVPRGLQTLVAPEHSAQGFRGSTDMFGLPHPVIDQNIYSLRPKEAPVDFNPNFFSVPAHVAQQQQSPLHQMNIKPIPESAREFFAAAQEESSKVPEASNSNTEEKESEQKSTTSNKSGGENSELKDKPPTKKLRKPKRKNRYNPHNSNEQRDSTEVNIAKPQYEQTTPRESIIVTRYKEKPTTIPTTTAEAHSTAAASFNSQNDIKDTSIAFKQRAPLLPKTLPEFSKLNGKVDFQKLNATISTSVSVSGGAPQHNNTSSEERENKRVFSSQNGGLAVVRKGPKRKRARQRVSTTTGVPYMNNDESHSDAKYEIAASVLDIIKATTETERQASGYYNKNEDTAPSRVSNVWVESKRTQ